MLDYNKENNYNDIPSQRLREIEKRVFNSSLRSRMEKKHICIFIVKCFAVLLSVFLLFDIALDFMYYESEFHLGIYFAIIFLVCVIVWNIVFLHKLYRLNQMQKTLSSTIKTCNFLVVMETLQTIFDLLVFIVLLINMRWNVLYIEIMIVVTVLGIIRNWSVLKMIKNLFIQIIGRV